MTESRDTAKTLTPNIETLEGRTMLSSAAGVSQTCVGPAPSATASTTATMPPLMVDNALAPAGRMQALSLAPTQAMAARTMIENALLGALSIPQAGAAIGSHELHG